MAKVVKVQVRQTRILAGSLESGLPPFGHRLAFPPWEFPGFTVLRVHRQDKLHLIEVFQRSIPLMVREPAEHRLWIVEETRVRIRGEEAD
jgi:hypothetical protein